MQPMILHAGYGRVAERFKAPVLKSSLGPTDLSSAVSFRLLSLDFSTMTIRHGTALSFAWYFMVRWQFRWQNRVAAV
jgi:hypothetical protein